MRVTTPASLALSVCFGLGVFACRSSAALSDEDAAAIHALDSAYVAAWLRDDTVGVLATVVPDAVLMPAGMRPLVGLEAIRSFWWPTDGSRTRVTAFTTTMDEIAGTSALAYARGTAVLSFTYDRGPVHVDQTSRIMTLTVFTRLSDGSWRISRRMWGPLGP